MNFKERYKKLNKKQREAVDHIDGPLLVVAGPGSGKTELISLRTANILQKTDTPAENVLCLTFTDTASSNMRERLIGLMGDSGYKVPIHTFHSFCMDVINRYPEFFHEGASFHPADEAVKISFIEQIIKEMEEDDPLSSYHPKEGYVYLSSIKECIGLLKEGGVSFEEFSSLISESKKEVSFIEKELSFLEERVHEGMMDKLESAVKRLLSGGSLSSSIGKKLEKITTTSELSKFKAKELVRSDDGYLLKDGVNMGKMESLSRVYARYRELMQSEGYYDFEDMLLQVISVLRSSEALRLTLQEKYLYIMVDEFQDTSGVQMRILELLTENEVNEGRPNICAVGDDDQAVYRFQGAEISNILRFKERYRDVKVVTLTDNYRSTQPIIDTAMEIIGRGEERLENIIPEVDKNLKAASKGKGKISLKKFLTEEEEFSFLVSEIEKLKVPYSEIAVISRLNKSLRKALPYFEKRGIPVFYQGGENILEVPHIQQIITILRFAVSFEESFLPQILAFPFWNISRESVWKTSLEARNKNEAWISCMKREVPQITEFLLDLGVRAQNEPAEAIIDIIIGNKEGTMKSPFKEYYFSEKRFDKERAEYLYLLSSLRSFLDALKKHKEGRMIRVVDVVEFVDLCEKNNIYIKDKGSYPVFNNSVSLLTAHGAKGMEFDTVFVLHCQNEVWNSNRGKRSKISFPANLPLERAGESVDDKLRLFYVTLTRAKRNLFLLSHEEDSKGKRNEPLPFLSSFSAERDSCKVDALGLEEKHSFFEFNKKEKDLLYPLLEKYKLSPTGFCLFLDVVDGGPQRFLEDVILRFPSKKTAPLSFGTAMHAVIADIYMQIKRGEKFPSTKEAVSLFEKQLHKERLSESDFKKYLQKGEKSLSVYLRKKKKEFQPHHQIEKGFKESPLEITGKVDKIVIEQGRAKIFDFKTGKVLSDWKGKDDYEKRKAWRYKKQLLFYKILIESVESTVVDEGVLEFLEPYKGDIVSLSLSFSKEDVEHTRALIKKVIEMVRKGDFPAVENYEKSYKGILKLEEDML